MLQVIFLAVSLLAGIPLGLLLKSNSERKLRGNITPWLPFGSHSLPWFLLGIVVKALLFLPLFFAPLYLISEVGHRLGFSDEQGAINFLYLVGILIGKGVRYAYWRRKDVWN